MSWIVYTIWENLYNFIVLGYLYPFREQGIDFPKRVQIFQDFIDSLHCTQLGQRSY